MGEDDDDEAVMRACACSFCGMGVGSWCIGSGWPTRSVHKTRRDAYERGGKLGRPKKMPKLFSNLSPKELTKLADELFGKPEA